MTLGRSRLTPRTVSVPGSRSSGRRHSRRKWVARVVFWGVLLVTWQVAAFYLGPLLLPGLQVVATVGIAEVAKEGYYLAFLETLRQLAVGFGISCCIAVPLGVLVGRSKVFADLILPHVYGIYVTPKEALLPLLIVLFGTELKFRVVVVILFSSFFVLMNTAAGVTQVDRGLLEAARSLCTSRVRIFVHILLPATMPYLIAGVRLGLGMAFNGMVIAELWVVTGTGGILKTLGTYQQLAAYFALAGLIAVAATGSYAALGVLERRLRLRHGLPAEGSIV